MAITRRQKEVLEFVSGFVERNGYSPSFEEIAHGLDLRSLATVHKHITNLQTKGLLTRAHNRSRSLDVLPPRAKGRAPDRLPLAGRIAAGYPVETTETPETISLGDIVGNRDVSPCRSAANPCARITFSTAISSLWSAPARPVPAKSSSPWSAAQKLP